MSASTESEDGMILEETFTLNNGVAIPKMALGTWLNAAGGLPDYGESLFFPMFGGKL